MNENVVYLLQLSRSPSKSPLTSPLAGQRGYLCHMRHDRPCLSREGSVHSQFEYQNVLANGGFGLDCPLRQTSRQGHKVLHSIYLKTTLSPTGMVITSEI